MKFKKISLILFMLIIFTSFFNSKVYCTNANVEYKAKILEIIELKQEVHEYEGDKSVNEYQHVKVKILSKGEYNQKEYEATYSVSIAGGISNPLLKKNQEVYVMIENDGTDVNVVVTDVNRIPYLILICVIFFAVIILIGGKQGLKTIASLVLTLLAIVYILIPMIMNGHSAIFASILVCTIISVITLLLVCGRSNKTYVAIIGTLFGVIVAGILVSIISYLASITGLSNEEAQMLFYITSDLSIDIKGLFFASILIGTVGATMDITMSISSSMSEVASKVKGIQVSELIKSGFVVGKDSMGTMSNTLILAYVGESLNLILLLMLNNPNFTSVINSDFIASEILRGLCGTIGMISAIPITAILFGVIYAFKSNNVSKLNDK